MQKFLIDQLPWVVFEMLLIPTAEERKKKEKKKQI